MPSGIAESGRQLPTAAGASAPLMNLVAGLQPLGGQNVSLLAVDVVQQGDPGTCGSDRIGSNRPRRECRPCCGGSRSARNCRLWPPPRCRAVILPWLFRPPLRFFGRSRPFTGLAPGVNSAKSLTVAPRRPGVVGLYLRIPMVVVSLSVISCQFSVVSFLKLRTDH